MTRVRLTHIRPMTFGYWVACFGTVFGLFVGLFLGLLSYANTERFAYFLMFTVATPIVFAIIHSCDESHCRSRLQYLRWTSRWNVF